MTLTNTECIRYLDKLNLIWWFDFRLWLIYDTILAASKILLASKVVRSDPKINHHASFAKT